MRDKGMLNLFNDLVGAAEEQEWHGKAERREIEEPIDQFRTYFIIGCATVAG